MEAFTKGLEQFLYSAMHGLQVANYLFTISVQLHMMPRIKCYQTTTVELLIQSSKGGYAVIVSGSAVAALNLQLLTRYLPVVIV